MIPGAGRSAGCCIPGLSMPAVLRPLPFVLASSNHGTMIVNRNDYHMTGLDRGYGVGHQILTTASFDQSEIDLALILLRLRQFHGGDGVFGIDCGANIGVHSIEWAKAMTGWGDVLAFEAQERVFYALAGNIAINNCLNARARYAAVGAMCGTLNIPEPDYLVPSSFGSLELRQSEGNEFIGQKIDYSDARLKPVDMVSIDSFKLRRVDLIKIDVEGMEMEVLDGAVATLARCKPVLLVEVIKTDRAALEAALSSAGYTTMDLGINLLALHRDDPLSTSITFQDGVLTVA